jgi:integrase-like protein
MSVGGRGGRLRTHDDWRDKKHASDCRYENFGSFHGFRCFKADVPYHGFSPMSPLSQPRSQSRQRICPILPCRLNRSPQHRRTRQAVDDYLRVTGKRPGELLFTGCRGPDRSMTTRQYARLVSEWIGSAGLDPRLFWTHSLRRTKATLIYRRTGNLRAVQLLLGHTKIESTVRSRGR